MLKGYEEENEPANAMGQEEPGTSERREKTSLSIETGESFNSVKFCC